MAYLGEIEHPLLDQMDAYDEMREELERKYFKRWVVIDGGRLVGDYATFHEADADAQARGLNSSHYLVQQVGVEPLPLPLIVPSELDQDMEKLICR